MKLRLIAFSLAFVLGLGFGIATAGPEAPAPTGVQVSGELGAPVTLVAPPALDITTPATDVLIAGEGREITADTQVLFIATSFEYISGDLIEAENSGELHAVSATREALGGLERYIIGTREGTRLLVRIPNETENNAELVVIDILYTHSTGEAAHPATLASVTFNEDESGLPTATGTASDVDDLASLVIKSGAGIQVHAGDTVIGNFRRFGMDGAIAEDTWTNPQPVVVPLVDVLTGLRTGLTDARVGSRIALVIPPELAQGEEQVTIVFDILGVLPTAN